MSLSDLIKSVKFASDDKITSARPTTVKAPIDVFIAGLKKQIELVKFDIDPDQYREEAKAALPEGVTYADPDGRRWYNVTAGSAYTFVKYGVAKVPLSSSQKEGNMAFHVGSDLTDVETFLEKLLTVAEAGSITARINSVAEKMKAERNKSRLTNKKNKEEAEKAKAAVEASE